MLQPWAFFFISIHPLKRMNALEVLERNASEGVLWQYRMRKHNIVWGAEDLYCWPKFNLLGRVYGWNSFQTAAVKYKTLQLSWLKTPKCHYYLPQWHGFKGSTDFPVYVFGLTYAPSPVHYANTHFLFTWDNFVEKLTNIIHMQITIFYVYKLISLFLYYCIINHWELGLYI